MNNIDMTVKDNILTVKIDLNQDFGPSKSGKTISVASTLGNKKVPGKDDVFIGVNVYQKR